LIFADRKGKFQDYFQKLIGKSFKNKKKEEIYILDNFNKILDVWL